MKIVLACLSLFTIVPVLGQRLVIQDVNVVDVEKQRILTNQSVAIEGERIMSIGRSSRFKTSDSDKIIDAGGKYLIPGLIDSHIHFFQSGGLYTRPDAVDLREWFSYSDEIQFAKDNAADYLSRYLSLGITTVMDVGGPMWNFAVRDSIAANITSPNVLVTGPLFSIVERPQLDEGDPPIIKVTSRDDIDELFDKMLPLKPDFMKIWYIASANYPAEESYPLVEYVAERCREANLRLAIHATQHQTAELAVKAGANILVHSVDDQVIGDTFLKALREQDVTYIPTMIVSKGYGRTFTGRLPHHYQDLAWANPKAYGTLMDLKKVEKQQLPAFLRSTYGQELPAFYQSRDSIMSINLKKLVDAGVNVATGTDAGNIGTMHASSYLQELEAMSSAGLSSWDILTASTINPAKGFGLSEEVGSIEEGKMADLVLLSADPIADLQALNKVEWIIKGGEVMEADAILDETPEQVVQRQLNAYNARNIDAFMATYSDDIEIFNEAGDLLFADRAAMRERYASLFEGAPNLFCEITGRIVHGNKVIDQERVQVNDRTVRAVAIYEVAESKIRKVTFLD